MMSGSEQGVTESLTMNNNIRATDIYQALPMCTVLRALQLTAHFILILSL